MFFSMSSNPDSFEQVSQGLINLRVPPDETFIEAPSQLVSPSTLVKIVKTFEDFYKAGYF